MRIVQLPDFPLYPAIRLIGREQRQDILPNSNNRPATRPASYEPRPDPSSIRANLFLSRAGEFRRQKDDPRSLLLGGQRFFQLARVLFHLFGLRRHQRLLHVLASPEHVFQVERRKLQTPGIGKGMAELLA